LKVITGAKIIDGRRGSPFEAMVAIADTGRIHSIDSPAEVSSSAERVRLDGMTLMPGLVDCHVHLLGLRSADDPMEAFATEGLRSARAAADAGNLLRAGFTTIRDAGSYAALAVTRAVDEGTIPGPRILPAGRFVERTGGADDSVEVPLAWAQCGGRLGPRMVDSPAEIRRAVREQVRDGAEWIKTCSTGAVHAASGDPNVLEWTDEELDALVDDTHRLGRRAMVHAHAPKGIHQAIASGADTIEHAMLLDRASARELAQTQTPLVPTLSYLYRLAEFGPGLDLPTWLLSRGDQLQEQHARAFRLAMEEGVTFAMGSDSSGDALYPHGENVFELEIMVRLGMSSMAALSSATSAAARALGIDDQLGTVAVGKVADLVAVRSDPLSDISALRQVCFVMQEGRVVFEPDPRA
jgi:imidazolonepropionase-like amidohydrolase